VAFRYEYPVIISLVGLKSQCLDVGFACILKVSWYGARASFNVVMKASLNWSISSVGNKCSR